MQTDLETATLIEDLIELPGFRAIREALMGAGAGAFRTMGLVCRDQAERIPDRIALRFEDEEVSYGAYNEGVNRFAHLLRRHGVGPGDVINIMMENSPQMLMAQGACAKVGAIGALINTHLEGPALTYVHRASTARVALVDEQRIHRRLVQHHIETSVRTCVHIHHVSDYPRHLWALRAVHS